LEETSARKLHAYRFGGEIWNVVSANIGPHLFASNVQQLCVVPDILIPWRVQESPTRTEAKIFHDLWTSFYQVNRVMRLEEIVFIGKFLTRPYVPPGRLTFRGMAQPVERKLPWIEVLAEADHEPVFRREERGVEASAYSALLIKQ
jgi:hypothetical protein